MTTPLTEARVIRNELEIPIEATPTTVWNAIFSDIQTWWHPDFHMARPDSEMHFEPELGGRMYESTEDGAGLIWGRVIAILPEQSVTLTGTWAPPYAGPATSTMHIALEEKDGGTLLKISDSVFGQVSDETATSVREGWLLLFRDGLKRHVEAS